MLFCLLIWIKLHFQHVLLVSKMHDCFHVQACALAFPCFAMLMLWPGDLVLAFWDVLLTLLSSCSIQGASYH